MKQIKPIGLVVAIKPYKHLESKTESGIIIPNQALKEEPIGDVIAVGNDTEDDNMIINVGDKVLYTRTISSIGEGDDEIRLIAQRDIIARVYED